MSTCPLKPGFSAESIAHWFALKDIVWIVGQNILGNSMVGPTVDFQFMLADETRQSDISPLSEVVVIRQRRSGEARSYHTTLNSIAVVQEFRGISASQLTNSRDHSRNRLGRKYCKCQDLAIKMPPFHCDCPKSWLWDSSFLIIRCC